MLIFSATAEPVATLLLFSSSSWIKRRCYVSNGHCTGTAMRVHILGRKISFTFPVQFSTKGKHDEEQQEGMKSSLTANASSSENTSRPRSSQGNSILARSRSASWYRYCRKLDFVFGFISVENINLDDVLPFQQLYRYFYKNNFR